MVEIIELLSRKTSQPAFSSCVSFNTLSQKAFNPYELGVLGQIRSSFVCNGFSRDPILGFKAFPDSLGVNNQALIDIDVANPIQRQIFGEFFQISISKFSDVKGNDIFKMESPLHKSSGSFNDVIIFVENFVNTNLSEGQRPIFALLKRL